MFFYCLCFKPLSLPTIFTYMKPRNYDANVDDNQACWVLCEIGRKPFSPVVVCHLSAKLRHKMVQRLRSREKRVHDADWPDIDEPTLEYIVNQVRSRRVLRHCDYR